MLSRTSSLAAAAKGRSAPGFCRQGRLDFQVLDDGAAREWAARHDNRQAWNGLHDACPWSTAFQSPAFFDVWCRHYGQNCPPILVIAHRENGSLAGIMPLAVNGDALAGIGTHQAEYHGWLCEQEDAIPFIVGALDALAQSLPGKSLRLRYLPPAVPPAAVQYLQRRNDRVIITRHHVHEFALDRAAIEKSLKKKGNKSKLNRLKRRGELDMRRLDANGLAVNLRRIMTLYDFRQGAVNGVCPFLDDPKKAAFHLDWIKSAPHQLHATALMVDDELASGLLLVMSGDDVHLAISSHAPEHAENSPMKLHLYRTALSLADEGRRTLDLTPGGDPWKERFSTNVRDVWELVMHRSLADAARARAVETGKNLVRRTLALAGLSVAQIKSAWRSVREALTDSLGRLIHPRPRAMDYSVDPARIPTAHPEYQVVCNDLDLLLRRGPGFAAQPRQHFLRQALDRIESGGRCYAVTKQGALLCLAWLSKADARIYDVALLPGETADAAFGALVARAASDVSPGRPLTVTVSSRATHTRDVLARLRWAQPTPSGRQARAAETVS